MDRLKMAFFISNFLTFSSIFLRRMLIFRVSVFEFSMIMSLSSIMSFLSSFISIPTSRAIKKLGIPRISIYILVLSSFFGYSLLLLGYFLSNSLLVVISIFLSLTSVFYSGVFEILYSKTADVRKLNMFDILISLSRVVFLTLYLMISNIAFLFALFLPFLYPFLIKGEEISIREFFKEYSISWFKFNKKVLVMSIIFSIVNAFEAFPIVFFSKRLKDLGTENPLVHQMMLSSMLLTTFYYFIKPSKKNIALAIFIRIFLYLTLILIGIESLSAVFLYFYIFPIFNSLVWVLISTSSRMLVLEMDPGEINFFNFLNSVIVSIFYAISTFFLCCPIFYFVLSEILLMFLLRVYKRSFWA